MDAPTRARLRAALSQRFPWLNDPALGPASVEAGECDACAAEARMVTTCGPGVAHYLGRRCLTEQGTAAYCDGHHDDARAALVYVAALPDEADLIARVWWVSTGEVTFQPHDEQVAQIAEKVLLLPARSEAQP